MKLSDKDLEEICNDMNIPIVYRGLARTSLRLRKKNDLLQKTLRGLENFFRNLSSETSEKYREIDKAFEEIRNIADGKEDGN